MDNRKLIEINKPLIQLVYSDGRITIPKNFRRIYNIEEGDIVEVLLIGFRKNNGGGNSGDNTTN